MACETIKAALKCSSDRTLFALYAYDLILVLYGIAPLSSNLLTALRLNYSRFIFNLAAAERGAGAARWAGRTTLDELMYTSNIVGCNLYEPRPQCIISAVNMTAALNSWFPPHNSCAYFLQRGRVLETCL